MPLNDKGNPQAHDSAYRIPVGSLPRRLRIECASSPHQLMPPNAKLRGTLWLYTDDLFAMFRVPIYNVSLNQITGVIYAERGSDTRALLETVIPHLDDPALGRAYIISGSDQYTAFQQCGNDGGVLALASREYWTEVVSSLRGLSQDKLDKIHPIMPPCPILFNLEQYDLMRHHWIEAWRIANVPLGNLVDWTRTFPLALADNGLAATLPADVISETPPQIHAPCLRMWNGFLPDTCAEHQQLSVDCHHLSPEFTIKLFKHIQMADKDGVLLAMSIDLTCNLSTRSLSRALRPKHVQDWINVYPSGRAIPAYFYFYTYKGLPVYEATYRKHAWGLICRHV